MKLKNLAICVALASISSQTIAAEIYKDNRSKLDLNVEFAIGATGGKVADTDVSQFDSTIAIAGEHAIDYRTKMVAKAEFDVNILESEDTALESKQGYIGLKHDTLGEVYLGTQKSPHYLAAEVVDKAIAFVPINFDSSDAKLGTTYAERQLSAHHSYKLDPNGAYGDIGISIGIQPETEIELGMLGTQEVDVRTQFGLSYDIDAFTIHYVNLAGDITSLDKEIVSHLVSAKLGQYGKGLYLATALTTGEYSTVDLSGEYLAESDGINAIAAYGFPNKLTVSVSYEHLNTGSDARGDEYSDKTAYSKSTVQAEYQLTKQASLFAGYEIDLDGTGAFERDGEKDHKWALGAKITL